MGGRRNEISGISNNFRTIGTKNVQSGGDESIFYYFDDENPLTGENFYKLKIKPFQLYPTQPIPIPSYL